MKRLIFLPLVGLLAGCSATAATEARRPGGAELLAACARLADDPEVRSWSCGPLTATESIVLSASDDDVGGAFEGFARSFEAARPRRVEGTWAAGDARHRWLRLEGETPDGRAIDAHMVAVVSGGGLRLVTCASRDPGTPCGPVVAMLVHGADGSRPARLASAD